jgi:hypothetical protein
VFSLTEHIKINLYREIEGNIQFGTISRSTTGNYYVSITCEVEYQPYRKLVIKLVLILGLKIYLY